MNNRIGFMQGRLSPLIDGKIQAFPWPFWQDEFSIAVENGFGIMEWTLDQDRLYENPLMTATGRKEIHNLATKYGITIPSLTGDCFMQSPFYKIPEQRESLLKDLVNIISGCAELGIRIILIPLVDSGKLENIQEEQALLKGLVRFQSILKHSKIKISFESEFEPVRLSKFIEQLDPECFGITYDIGNSASLGYKPDEEIDRYGHRIVNVHVKDRVIDGGTVPLGQGDADIFGALQALHRIGYAGNYILQTARADNGDHVGALCHYRDQVADWLTSIGKR